MNHSHAKNHSHGLAVLLALSLSVAAGSALALPTLTYTTDNYGAVVADPFGGFDWNSAGSAVTVGAPVFDGATVFTTEYWADAVNILQPGGAAIANTQLEAAGILNGAEFTIQALIQETAIPAGANTVEFTAVGGTFNIWYEATANANLVTGAGITDGTLVMSGNILPGFAGAFTETATGGAGVSTFFTDFTFVNAAFFDPTDFLGSTNVATLQIGDATTAWTQPISRPGGAIDANALVLQADGNQIVQPPALAEPSALLLVSLGLIGAIATRKRSDRS